MRVLHFDCFSGISGDMTLAALIDAGVDATAIQAGLDSLGLPIRLQRQKVRKGGFAATQVTIDAPDQATHRYLADVEHLLQSATLSRPQRELALRIFRRLAEAEAEAHGMPLEQVHFHEVGALDSIADIVGVAIGLDLLRVDYITSRSVVVGSGTVRCAHGVMPVPTPGTAVLLRGVPLAATHLKGELTTPTGAAILTTVVQEWVDAPTMQLQTIGHGAGRKEFPDQPNLLRLLIGHRADALGAAVTAGNAAQADRVWIVETNLDDVTPEIVGFTLERLWTVGVLDAFTMPIQMKKQRPGVLLSVIVAPEQLDAVEKVLFQETGTFGIRRTLALRSKLQRESCEVVTRWGPIPAKRGWRDDGFALVTPEYEACARIARDHQVPLREVYDAVRSAAAAASMATTAATTATAATEGTASAAAATTTATKAP